MSGKIINGYYYDDTDPSGLNGHLVNCLYDIAPVSFIARNFLDVIYQELGHAITDYNDRWATASGSTLIAPNQNSYFVGSPGEPLDLNNQAIWIDPNNEFAEQPNYLDCNAQFKLYYQQPNEQTSGKQQWRLIEIADQYITMIAGIILTVPNIRFSSNWPTTWSRNAVRQKGFVTAKKLKAEIPKDQVSRQLGIFGALTISVLINPYPISD